MRTVPSGNHTRQVAAAILALVTAATAESAALPFRKGSTTLVVLPDTEVYTNKRPDTFRAMMQWVVDNRASRNIAYILHVGDVTNNNTRREWQVARECFDLVEGRIPYVLAAGNHDYDHTPGRLTYMNEFFRVEDQKKRPTFGDVYEPGKLENHYQYMEIHGRKWIVLSLEMGPRREVIAWANKVLAAHRDRLAIVLTHGYLFYNNVRYNHLRGSQRASPYNFYGDGADGEMLWNGMVRRHPNVMMVICGHLSSAYVGYRADEGDYGNTVHQMLVDYEKMRGGMGFLRLLEFLPDGKTVQVRTYSPVTGGTNPRDPKLEEFAFTLQAATRDKPRAVSSLPAAPLAHGPTHRYTFERDPKRAGMVVDSIGSAHGRLRKGATLDDKGVLTLDGEAYVALPPRLLQGLRDVSFEFWYKPAADSYRWHSVVYFGDGRDWLHYCYRNAGTHRAEIAVNRHNEDIQLPVPLVRDRFTHVVVTYDHDGADDGRALLCYYRDGRRYGALPTGLKLTDVDDTANRVGPFAGQFAELRIYRHALTPEEVAGNFNHGPDELNLPGDRTKKQER